METIALPLRRDSAKNLNEVDSWKWILPQSPPEVNPALLTLHGFQSCQTLSGEISQTHLDFRPKKREILKKEKWVLF